MTPRKFWIHASAFALAALLLTLPVLADNSVITKGADYWRTAGNGLTLSSFHDNPLPADFFCAGSEPFTGSIALEGQPLVTDPARRIGQTDTIVQRLDDARFNAEGVAYTRIRLLALSLAATKPVETKCGAYQVHATLTGNQPTTKMKITRTSENGGTYDAPLALYVKVVFEPVAGNPNPRRDAIRLIELGPGTRSVWTYQVADPSVPTRVDTDGDQIADAYLPGSSNFLVGVQPVATQRTYHSEDWMLVGSGESYPSCPTPLCPYQSCHCAQNEADWDPFDEGLDCVNDHLHCLWVCVQYADIACDTARELPIF
jgi:hypothetical protein